MAHFNDDNKLDRNDISEILETVNELLKGQVAFDEVELMTPDELIDYLYHYVLNEYETKVKDLPEEITDEFEKAIT